jgi:hypothetical protein
MTGLISLFLVPVAWAIFLSVVPMSTPGLAVAQLAASAQPSALLDINKGFAIAATVDFVVWFGFLWGAQNLMTQFREERRSIGIGRRWPNPMRRPGVWSGALLCAIPLSFYVVLGTAISVKLSALQRSQLFLTISFALCFAFSSAAICVVYAAAVRFWPKTVQLNR